MNRNYSKSSKCKTQFTPKQLHQTCKISQIHLNPIELHMSSSRRKGILNKNMISPGYKVHTISTDTYLPPSLHMSGVDVGIYNRWEAF